MDVTPSVCLAMIVRDEADTLPALAENVLPYVDSAVIVDTGSTDSTVEVAQRDFGQLPGMLTSRPWVDFGHNRSELLMLAREVSSADYLLLMDAGWTLAVGELPTELADCYWARFERGGVEWWRPLLIRADLPWRYEGVTHELLVCDQEYTSARLEGVTVHPGEPNTGRFRRDLPLLADALAANPQDTRAAFYLAQTWRDMQLDEPAAVLYRERAEMSTDQVEETYVAWLECGRALRRLGRWTEATEAFARAWDTRPQRLEAVHDLIDTYRCNDLHHLAWSIAQGFYLPPIPPDTLFLEPWVYTWGLLFQFSICAYWVGRYEDAIDACGTLLERDIPEHVIRQTLHNLGHAERALRREAA